MKKISRLLAVVLGVIMISAAFVGCHDKDEIAFTIGDSKFTSAMYSCVLYAAADSARGDIDTYISDNKIEVDKVNYASYKFDAEGNVSAEGTVTYNTFVRNEAIKTLKQFASLEAIMKANNLELDSDSLNSAKYEAACLWNYGCNSYYYQYYASKGVNPLNYFAPMSQDLGENGVAYSTFEKYMIYNSMYDFYFEHLYGEGGEKALPETDINDYMTKHYTVADTITFSKKDSNGKDLSDEKLAELKALADGYAERLNAGEAFEDIYAEENKRLEEEKKKDDTSSSNSTSSGSTSSNAISSEATSSGTASSETTSSEEEDKGYTPPDYTGLFGDEETSYEYALFSEMLKQDIGKAVVLEDTENSQYLLIVRRDMNDEAYEEYWFDNLRDSITYAMKQDEFDNSLNEYGNSLKLTEDTYATKSFGVDDIKYAS